MSEEAAATPEVTTEVIETLPSDWVNGLPAELKDAPFLRPNKDGTIRPINEVLSALENAAKLQGNMAETHIKIDSPDASDDTKAATRARILEMYPNLREVTEGEDTLPPAEVAGYKLPEGAEVLDATMVADIGQFAIDHNWGQQQFSDYAAKMIEAQTSSTENASQWEKAQQSKLTDKLGTAKAEHLNRTAAALEAAGATPEYVAAIKEGKVDADLVMVIDNLVGKMIDLGDEGSQFVQQVKAGARERTPSEHRDRVAELRGTLDGIPRGGLKYIEIQNKIKEHIGLSLQ
jgi:hypothetical protein